MHALDAAARRCVAGSALQLASPSRRLGSRLVGGDAGTVERSGTRRAAGPPLAGRPGLRLGCADACCAARSRSASGSSRSSSPRTSRRAGRPCARPCAASRATATWSGAAAGGLRPSLPNVRSMTQVYEVRVVIEELCVRRAVAVGDRALLECHPRRLARPARRGAGAARRGRTSCMPTSASTAASPRPRGTRWPRGSCATSTSRSGSMRINDFTTPDRVRATIVSIWRTSTPCWRATRTPRPRSCVRTCRRSALVVRQRVGAVLARMADAAEAPRGA